LIVYVGNQTLFPLCILVKRQQMCF